MVRPAGRTHLGVQVPYSSGKGVTGNTVSGGAEEP